MDKPLSRKGVLFRGVTGDTQKEIALESRQLIPLFVCFDPAIIVPSTRTFSS